MENEMADIIRYAVGILGNCTSLLMYGAPILTFRRVIKKRSTEEFSGFPYAIALLNCLLYTWYGTPLISRGMENILMSTVNGIGIVLEGFFVGIYVVFAPPKSQRKMVRMFVTVMVLFATVLAISLLVLHDHSHRKLLVGSAAMAVTVVMYGSPLSVIRLVIRTKSVEFMPFYLSFFSFLTSVLWMTYGILGKDMIVAAPNIAGLPLGMAQIVLYCIYRSGKNQPAFEAGKLDQPDPEMALQRSNERREGNAENSSSPMPQCPEMQMSASKGNSNP